ncbi:hypothetical protein BJY04DRAFT_184958 [Aspergillus karnatakaensis]|uniref:uncharacterized protein n=1 Tax=Aspergillus karnatakaensis TaxID=1810916 RepID=UPI003CCCB9C8
MGTASSITPGVCTSPHLPAGRITGLGLRWRLHESLLLLLPLLLLPLPLVTAKSATRKRVPRRRRP